MNSLNLISILATFTFVQVFFYFFFNIIVNKLDTLNKEIVYRVQIKHLLSFIIATFLMIKYTIFYLPYK